MWEETSNENESSKSSILEESDSVSNRSEKGSKMAVEEQDQLQIDNTY